MHRLHMRIGGITLDSIMYTAKLLDLYCNSYKALIALSDLKHEQRITH